MLTPLLSPDRLAIMFLYRVGEWDGDGISGSKTLAPTVNKEEIKTKGRVR